MKYMMVMAADTRAGIPPVENNVELVSMLQLLICGDLSPLSVS